MYWPGNQEVPGSPWTWNLTCITPVDPAVLLGECEATAVVVFPWARIPHTAPAYPAG